MLDVVVKDGKRAASSPAIWSTGSLEDRHVRARVVLATGGYSNAYYLSTNAMASNVSATYRAYKRGAAVRQPVLHADSPHLHPRVKGELSVQADADERESLRNDGRVWVPRESRRQTFACGQIPESRTRLLTWRSKLPHLRQPGPARHRLPRCEGSVRTRAAAWAKAGKRCLPRLHATPSNRLGADTIKRTLR